MRFDGHPSDADEKTNKNKTKQATFQISRFYWSFSSDVLAVKGLRQKPWFKVSVLISSTCSTIGLLVAVGGDICGTGPTLNQGVTQISSTPNQGVTQTGSTPNRGNQLYKKPSTNNRRWEDSDTKFHKCILSRAFHVAALNVARTLKVEHLWTHKDRFLTLTRLFGTVYLWFLLLFWKRSRVAPVQ